MSAFASSGRGVVRLLAAVAAVLLVAGCAEHSSESASRRSPDMLVLPPAGSVVAFYGDSLTSGFRASSPAARWSALLCARHGWTEVNPSIPGLGFVHNRAGTDVPAEVLTSHPSMIFVTLGANDLRIIDSRPDDVRTAIDADLQALRAGAPTATILVAMPFSPLTYRPPQLLALEAYLRSAAESVSAYVIESDAWMAGRTDLTADGIHLTDAGEQRIADLMDEALTHTRAG